MDVEFKIEPNYMQHKWVFKKANCDEFKEISENSVTQRTEFDQNLNEMDDRISSLIYFAASQCIPNTQGKKSQRNIPWWNYKCTEVIRDQN